MDASQFGADMARCAGVIYVERREVCPQRDNCLRYTMPPIKDHPRQAWVCICGADELGNCSEFWDKNG